LIFQIQDITDKKFVEDKLQYEATHDALTNLPNRAKFMSRLDETLARKQTDSAHKVSILFIDLDRFKVINDSLGHLAGDQLLFEIAGRLRECLRPEDLVARLGGDEFTILVEGDHEANETVKIAERIQKKLAEPFDLCGNEVYSSASIGILHASDKHLTSEELMRDADTAMYQAKRGGKARHEVFDADMHEAAKEILQLETDLRRAVEKDEFIVYYQPIFSLLDGKIEGFEALARWFHPTLGDISPTKFIALAEEIGLIDVLGEQILHKACGQMVSIKNDDDSPFLLSVNLSCKQFAHPALVKRIKRILEETRFPPTCLKLEITESVFFEHREAAVVMLGELRELGIEINIDDFGTGYSNLSYLRQLPITTLKIDRSFISPIEADGGNTEIIQTIITLARNLGLRVVAEGVENEMQIEQLKKLDCEGAQGYFFAEPMAFEKVRSFLNKNGIADLPEGRFEDVPVLATIQ
jgi:diguanylate cyclase (GGDEF)-like protein